MAHEELPLFVLWERILGDLLDRTLKFPKHARFTFSTRIDNHALDILEGLVEACYARPERKARLLARIDTRLAKLRVMLRLSFERGYLSRGGFAHVIASVDEAGRMLGGWRRQQAGR